MVHSLAIIAVMIGRHMEPGGWVEERERDREGEAWSLIELTNKSEPRQLLSPQSTLLKIWNRDLGVARCQKPCTSKV